MISPDWKDCKNILCVRLDNLGDVLMTQPALRALRKDFPESRLTLLTSHMGAGIARMLPEVDEVMAFDVPWVKQPEKTAGEDKVPRLIGRLKRKHFDAAVIFTNFSQSALPTAMLLYLAKIPRVLGYCRENPYYFINHWVPDNEPFVPIKHGVQRQLDLVRTIGATTDDDRLCLAVPVKTGQAVLKKIRDRGLNINRPWLVLHPGVSEQKRQYPMELYAQAAKKIVSGLGMQIVMTGNEEEKDITAKITQDVGKDAFDLSGQLRLEELVALLSQTSLLISNNSGPVHIAAALQVPVVVLYARSNPEHTPWKVRNQVLYFDVPPDLRSKNTTLSFITPAKAHPLPTPRQVVDAVEELLRQNKAAKKDPGVVGSWL